MAVAVVGDQGTSNVKAIKELRRQYEENCSRKGEESGTLFRHIYYRTKDAYHQHKM